jgi:hypothetical protein
VFFFPNADAWTERLLAAAKDYGIEPTFSRTGRNVTLGSWSYFSYGRMYHKPKAMVPAGRLLIDIEQSFTYREGGLPGVLVAARITGLSLNRTARVTPGTLQERRRAMLSGVSKDLTHPFAADAIVCSDGRDTLAMMIRRDDGRGIISRQLLHTHSLNGCQVIRRLYILARRAKSLSHRPFYWSVLRVCGCTPRRGGMRPGITVGNEKTMNARRDHLHTREQSDADLGQNYETRHCNFSRGRNTP